MISYDLEQAVDDCTIGASFDTTPFYFLLYTGEYYVYYM